MFVTRFIKKYILEITTFVSGAITMILEMVGSRVIAPYLGTSTIVWTCLIGVILASLSIGYWLGGKLSDKHPTEKFLEKILFTSSIFVLLIAYFPTFVGLFTNQMEGLATASLVMTIILFTPATILLGMVSPFVVKLKLKDINISGSQVGLLYAISTVGSIFGTFCGGLFLVLFFHTNTIIKILSLILFILSFIFFLINKSRKYFMFLCVFILIFLSFYSQTKIILSDNLKLVADIDTQYGRIWIYDAFLEKDKRTARLISNSFDVVQSGMYLDNTDELVLEYTKTFALDKIFKPNFKEVLHIGAGAFSYPKYFLKNYPNAQMDLVEIDPKMLDIAEKYFYFKPDPRISITNEDGRTFLNKNKKIYDVIYMDAFSSKISIPHNLATQETVQKIYKSLSGEGVVLVNIISGVSEKNDFLFSMYKTYSSVFPYVKIYKVQHDFPENALQNLLMVASKEPIEEKDKPDDFLRDVLDNEVIIPKTGLLLTDDFVPVEKYLIKTQL